MLFMGEEYGENAPFQFFSDHIDEKIAVATREGRRREFASFAQFGQEVPDPQDRATFERSKLTRQGEPRLADLYRRLIAARAELPHGDADAIEFDEDARWLRVRRGEFELVCNFAAERASVPCGAAVEIVLATHDGTELSGGQVELAGLSGALIR
jgi:maltooligosyltrehalose trehalohydrolase